MRSKQQKPVRSARLYAVRHNPGRKSQNFKLLFRKTTKTVLSLAVVTLFLLGCQAEHDEAPLSVNHPTFRLADGTPLSLPNADEYNPVLMQTTGPNPRLYLIFGSNRNGYHNLYLTRSISGQSYTNPRQLPPFEEPQVLGPNNTPLNYETPITFTAILSAPTINIMYNTPSGIRYFTYHIDYNTAYTDYPIYNSIHAQHQIIGATSFMIIGKAADGAVRFFDPDMSDNGLNPPEVHLQNAQSVASFDIYDVGHDKALLYLQQNTPYLSGKPMQSYPPPNFGQTVMYGEHVDLDSSLKSSKLIPRDFFITSFDSPAMNMILLSAHDGKSLDLYGIISHSPIEMWNLRAPLISFPLQP